MTLTMYANVSLPFMVYSCVIFDWKVVRGRLCQSSRVSLRHDAGRTGRDDKTGILYNEIPSVGRSNITFEQRNECLTGPTLPLVAWLPQTETV